MPLTTQELKLVEAIFRNCTKCMHWIPGNPLDKNGMPITTVNDAKSPPETCRLYKMRPPAKIIVRGCKDFVEDEIPF